MMKWIMAVAALLTIVACGAPSKRSVGDLIPDGPPAITSNEYAPLDWAARIGTVVAVGAILASVWFPSGKLRMTAALAVGIAVVSWVLKYMLVYYLWLAVLLAFLASVLFALAFLWGHQKWLERKLNLDINRDGRIGE